MSPDAIPVTMLPFARNSTHMTSCTCGASFAFGSAFGSCLLTKEPASATKFILWPFGLGAFGRSRVANEK